MLAIDKSILDCSSVICKNISRFDETERGLLSQNILSQLRNLIEYIVIKVCLPNEEINPSEYEQNPRAMKILKTRGEFRSLYEFHELLQKSVSHYTLDENGSERLMIKYYKYLLIVKDFVKKHCNLEILQNISDFPINTDKDLDVYYQAVAQKIEQTKPAIEPRVSDENRYYIQKIKPFFVNSEIYYEVTFTMAFSNISKFDRVIAFTKKDILPNYSVKFSQREENIDVMGNTIKIIIIDAWSVSIRPCEVSNYIHIFDLNIDIRSDYPEYKMLMSFLTQYHIDLCEFVTSLDDFYSGVKKDIIAKTKDSFIFNVLDKSRRIINENLPGSRVLRYLLFKMRRDVIKCQIGRKNDYFQGLLLDYGCIPFDKMPFCTALRNHNPKICDLLDCIPSKNRDYEFLVKSIQIETEIKGNLFTKKSDLEKYGNVDSLINIFNRSLYYKHENRKIKEIKENCYIKEYAEYCAKILSILSEFASSGITGYQAAIQSWLSDPLNTIDDNQKIKILKDLFVSSRVAFIYGAAGTGKSTLIGHISKYYSMAKKLYLAVTHPAVENLKRKTPNINASYMTIESYLNNSRISCRWDLIVVDECSTVSNEQMVRILNKSRMELLILVGDVHQIESIRFGNWFTIAKNFLPQNCIYELTNTYRSSNDSLKLLWSRVRNYENSIQEVLNKNNMSAKLEDFDFQYRSGDEIVLCLNYDGLYGINNINAFLQGKNRNASVIIGVKTYKVGDPILFNESNRFSPLIYNNMKGRIVQLWQDKVFYYFHICLEIAIDQVSASGYDFVLLPTPGSTTSTIRIKVPKYRSTDDDYERLEDMVPFQVAYAVSIHKAQGLEYDSVKIVVSNEVDEKITHNIFYTAITRARKELKIYWSPEVENKVIESFKPQNKAKDVALLKLLYGL
ncbi:MAG: ATP-dependent RecD-like DNA helicase [Fibrobacter sp.]|nr:ATP-dependent RecD-like DNA helicase [Fibrobacter sp.]